MTKTSQHSIRLGNRRVAYRLAQSPTARKLRVRVGPRGVEVIKPLARPRLAVDEFLRSNQSWLLGELDRVAQLGDLRRAPKKGANEILFRGVPTPVRIENVTHKRRENRIVHTNGEIIIQRGSASRVPLDRSLDHWLRREARCEIEKQLDYITAKLKRLPNRVYVMDQRTKWGNCSRKGNLSFSWRLIMAPPEVLNYMVTHEVAHLVEPNHSQKFWLLIRSHCPQFCLAKDWLKNNQSRLFPPLDLR